MSGASSSGLVRHALRALPVDGAVARDRRQPGYRARATGFPGTGAFPDREIDLVQHILRGLGVATDTVGDPEKLRAGQRIEFAKRFAVLLPGAQEHF